MKFQAKRLSLKIHVRIPNHTICTGYPHNHPMYEEFSNLGLVSFLKTWPLSRKLDFSKVLKYFRIKMQLTCFIISSTLIDVHSIVRPKNPMHVQLLRNSCPMLLCSHDQSR